MKILRSISKIFREKTAMPAKTYMSYEKMLERAYTDFATKETITKAKQCYISIRAVELAEETDNETTIKINKKILELEFFDKLLSYLYKIYWELDFYESLLLEALATDDESQKQCVLIRIEKIEKEIANLRKKHKKRFVFLLLFCHVLVYNNKRKSYQIIKINAQKIKAKERSTGYNRSDEINQNCDCFGDD